MAVISKTTVHKIQPSRSFRGTVGAGLRGADLEHTSEADFEIIRKALYENQVIMFKGQQDLSPRAQYELTRMFDPEVDSYGHGNRLARNRSCTQISRRVRTSLRSKLSAMGLSQSLKD